MINFSPLQKGYENIADKEKIVTEIKKNRGSEYRAYSIKVALVESAAVTKKSNNNYSKDILGFQ